MQLRGFVERIFKRFFVFRKRNICVQSFGQFRRQRRRIAVFDQMGRCLSQQAALASGSRKQACQSHDQLRSDRHPGCSTGIKTCSGFVKPADQHMIADPGVADTVSVQDSVDLFPAQRASVQFQVLIQPVQLFHAFQICRDLRRKRSAVLQNHEIFSDFSDHGPSSFPAAFLLL